MSLGNGLGKLAGKVFRIGHLGDFSDLMLAGTLGGIEMGLALAKVPFSGGGIDRSTRLSFNTPIVSLHEILAGTCPHPAL